MTVKIYSAHVRQPKFHAAHDIFIPIWAGGEPANNAEWITDASIPSVSHVIYNDMSHQYYVYKHLLEGSDYVGFEHYRRLLPFPAFIGAHTPLTNAALTWHHAGVDWHATVTKDTFNEMIASREHATPQQLKDFDDYVNAYDIVFSQPTVSQDLREQWKTIRLQDEVFDTLVACIRASAYYQKSPFDLNVDAIEGHFCNIYVMRRWIFEDYMRLWQDVMFALTNHMAGQMPRMPAFLSERLFSIYVRELLKRTDLTVAKLPFLWCPDA